MQNLIIFYLKNCMIIIKKRTIWWVGYIVLMRMEEFVLPCHHFYEENRVMIK